MRATGVTDYRGFALDLLEHSDRPISFEVFADEEPEMEEQARHIAAWGKNVFVKVPVMNTKGADLRSGPRSFPRRNSVERDRAAHAGAGAESLQAALRATLPPMFPSLPAASPTPAAIRCR
jgi:hypothetical protein